MGNRTLTVSGAQLSARTVVEVDCDHVPSPADARSPNAITTGSGTGVVHRDGVAVPGIWSRPTAYDPFTFVDAATRAPVPLDTGRSFLELVRA